jgi:hypothetical protein
VSTSPPAVHLVVRYRDPEPSVRTIERHREVLDAHGAVWFGKVGKTLGEQWTEAIRAQVAAGTDTYLYLAARPKNQLVMHRGQVAHITRSRPSNGHLIPEYYLQLGLEPDISFWTLVQSLDEVPEEGLRDLVVASSQRPVLESLRSSAPILVVRAR